MVRRKAGTENRPAPDACWRTMEHDDHGLPNQYPTALGQEACTDTLPAVSTNLPGHRNTHGSNGSSRRLSATKSHQFFQRVPRANGEKLPIGIGSATGPGSLVERLGFGEPHQG